MSPRIRKLIGAFAFLIGLALYAILAAALGNWIIPSDAVGWTIVYFIFMGFVWVPLFVPLVRWMEHGSFKPKFGDDD